jgi:hypothetical protein
MSAVMSRPLADYTSTELRSIDELDAAICRLVEQMNIDCYRMLVLVREFDDRFGWMKWSFKTCAEWLAWRCSFKPSTAREKVRTAHALRRLPAIAKAFAEERVSYSKVRALTRVADLYREDLLLQYALEATLPDVEERCRQIRNVAPDHARRAWAGRSLTMWRDEGRGLMRFTVEVPIEEGELISRALDCAVAAGEVTTEIDPKAAGGTRRANWSAQQADALVAVVKSHLGGEHGGEGGATADHYQVVVHADAKAVTGGGGCSDLPIDTVKRLLCDGSLVLVAEDENGYPLDVGQRTVSTALRRALYARDRKCTFPGCHRTRYLDGHHLKHWIHGGETVPDNMTLQCDYHHRLLHEGAFSIVKEDGALRFITADGRTIPRNGYRLEDFVDDGIDGGDLGDADASRDAFCTAAVQSDFGPADVRETRAVYRLKRTANVI